jgi:hypothetical protein
MVMVFNATLNNISAISWHSVLLVQEIVVPREIYNKFINVLNDFIKDFVTKNNHCDKYTYQLQITGSNTTVIIELHRNTSFKLQ